jgi:hypothetical protein
MTRHEKLLMRLAIAIYERRTTKQAASSTIELPTASWQQSEDIFRRIRRARQRGWQLAAQRLHCDLQESLRRLRGELTAIERVLDPPISELRITSIADIYADLLGLHEEFDQVSFDQQGRTISVTTEPIDFDGISLGAFEIRLDWSDLSGARPSNYRVIAIDANPAASNEGVTHPHVQDEAVCEGEGRLPIQQSLQQGRLLDFFLIVTNLLRTYNPGSPYVAITDWQGVECSDCATLCDGDCWTCEKCETTVCGECYVNCPECDGIYCNYCVSCCQGCEENHCTDCMKTCSRCRAELCKSCLDNKERCSDCHDQETKKTCEDPVDGAKPTGKCHTVASVHADCLGQIAVPA